MGRRQESEEIAAPIEKNPKTTGPQTERLHLPLSPLSKITQQVATTWTRHGFSCKAGKYSKGISEIPSQRDIWKENCAHRRPPFSFSFK